MQNSKELIQILNFFQLNNQVEKHIDFLKLIHPFLLDNNFHEECIELRPIIRANCSYIKSLNLWRADDKGMDALSKFLKKANGQAVCLYYSAFCFDYNMVVNKDEGKKYGKGKINAYNSLYTQILVADYDNINIEDHTRYIDILKSIGLKTVSIFTGHGYQDIILLDNKAYDKDLLKKFTYLLISKGFPVDEKTIDSARVFRMPYTFNCKSFDINSKYYNQDAAAVPVKIISSTHERYSPEYVFSKLSDLQTVSEEYYNKYLSLGAAAECNNYSDLKSMPVTNKEEDFVEIKSIYDEYNMVNFDMLPDAVKNMLIDTPEGYRNSVLLFLVPFFKNKIGLSLDKLLDLFITWGKRCTPTLDREFVISEVKRIYGYNYSGTGAYTADLSNQFGYINFETYKRDNKLTIPNELFDDYNVLSDMSVRIYLMMVLYEKLEEIKEWTAEDIMRDANISLPSFTRHIKDLINLGYIDINRNYKKDNLGYRYYINKFFNASKGFTMFETATLDNMVYNSKRRLTDGEIKLYTYLCKMIGSGKDYCYPSQIYIANAIGKKRGSLTRMTDNLVSKRYIKKDIYTENYIQHCIYTLNY